MPDEAWTSPRGRGGACATLGAGYRHGMGFGSHSLWQEPLILGGADRSDGIKKAAVVLANPLPRYWADGYRWVGCLGSSGLNDPVGYSLGPFCYFDDQNLGKVLNYWFQFFNGII